MTSSIVGEVPFGKRAPALRALLDQREIWLIIIAMLALAVLTRHEVVANTDVSWGITMAEKVLAGARPYVDFIEPNPPSYIYLHVAPVIIARLTGFSPEPVMDALVLIAIVANLWVAGRVLRRAGLLERFDAGKLLVMSMAILAIVPAQTFAEREHIALVLFLPMLCVMLARAAGATPSRGDLLVAGLGAGAMMVLKPYLAVGLVMAVAMAAWSARSWRILVAAENWIAFAVHAAYGATIVVVFPEFLKDTVPLLRAVYLPVRLSLWELGVVLPGMQIWAWTLVAVAVVRRSERYDPSYGILIATSLGFAASFFAQGKGWPYHSYPMMALGLIALACALSERRARAPAPLEQVGGAVVAGLLGFVTFTWMNVAGSLTSLVVPIGQIKPHPTMLAISHNIAIGHPLVRQVEGTWVSAVPSMWMTGGALFRRAHEALTPEENAALDRYIFLDRSLMINALRRMPEIIVIQKAPADFETWARADSEIDALLKPYKEAVTTPEVLVLRRDGS